MSKIIGLLAVVICFFCSSLPAAQPNTIHWATDAWPNFTENKTGLYVELMDLIFADSQYQINVQYYPWPRVMHLVTTHKAHMTGAVPTSLDNLLFSEHPVLSQSVSAIIKASAPAITDHKQLYALTGTWRKGYLKDFVHQILPPPVTGAYSMDEKAAIKLLLDNKVDYYMEFEVLTSVLVNQNPQLAAYPVGVMHLHWGFTDNEQGKQLKTFFDKRVALLKSQNKLQDLYNKYNIALPMELQ